MSVARVQNASSGVNAASLTVVLDAPPTPGNLLVAWANSDATVTIGPEWTAGPSVIDGNGAYSWHKIAQVGEPAATTFAPSVPDWICAGVLEYSGLTAAPFDTSGASMISATPSTATVPVTVTTTAGHELGVALAHLHTSNTSPVPTAPAWTGGYTTVQAQGMTGGGTTAVYTICADNLDLGPAGTSTTACSWTGTWLDAQALVLTFTVEAPGHGSAALPTASALAVNGRQHARAGFAAAPSSGATVLGIQNAQASAAAALTSTFAASGETAAHGTAAPTTSSGISATGRQQARGGARAASASALNAIAGGYSRRTPRPFTGITLRP